MNVWAWAALGGGIFLVASVMVTLGVAAVLGSLGRVSRALEAEPWPVVQRPRAKVRVTAW